MEATLMVSKASEGFDTTVIASNEASAPRPSEGFVMPDPVRVDHFDVEGRLGAGGMGAVFAAHDTSLDRKVALKILPSELAGSREAQERFIREARAQAKLNSPHVVHIYFIGFVELGDARSLYFAMEAVGGGSLAAFTDRGETLDPERARRLLLQAAKGLSDAHRAGIIHRDIKPANLLLDDKGELKIADFGLAKPKDSSLGLTAERTIMGTPLYIAPEQANGDALDHRADMYALGCSFYHLLSGAPPFEAPTSIALMMKHIGEQEPPLRKRAPNVPPKLAEVIARLMKKKPEQRFATYEELTEALEAAAPEHVEYAGFSARGVASLIDSVLASVLIALVGWPGLVVHLVYITAANARFGQTLGKYLMSVKVRRVDGSPLVGVRRALIRTLSALWLPFLVGLESLWTRGFRGLTASITLLDSSENAKKLIVPFAVAHVTLTLLFVGGLAFALVNQRRRALHDFLSGTEVIYRLGPRA